MRVRKIASVLLLLSLSACMGTQTGAEAGWGLGALDTQSKEDKENDAWFKSFYGTNHCHGQWGGGCKQGEGSGGSIWGTSGSSDAGSAD